MVMSLTLSINYKFLSNHMCRLSLSIIKWGTEVHINGNRTRVDDRPAGNANGSEDADTKTNKVS